MLLALERVNGANGALAAGVDSFVVDEVGSSGKVLYPSAIEAATSAMEVVAVSGANAASLIAASLE